jgi:membrane glycosyltransferase
MGINDLLPMVPVQWLGIAFLHGLFLTTVSTWYASTTSMYLSPIVLSLQKSLCCSSIVLCVRFLFC